MHILLISTYGFDTRFPSRPEFVLARALAELGHTVSAVEYWHTRTQPQTEVYQPGLTIYRCRTFGFASWDLWRLARRLPLPDIIHVHHLRHLLAYQAQMHWRGRVPMVLTPHGILHDGDLVVDREMPLQHPLTPEKLLLDRGRLWRALARGGYPRRVFRNYFIHAPLLRYDGVFALSHHEKSIIADLGVEPDRIAVIPNAIILERYADPAPARPVQAPWLLFIGQLVPRKGWDILIDALPTVLQHHPTAHLTIVTHNTSQRDLLEARAAALGVSACIEIRTRVDEDEKVRLLEAADILVAPSRYEGFGIPPIEAMAAGCAVITTDCAAGNEIVAHEQTGLLTGYDDAASVAAAVCRLIENPAERARYVAAGAQYAHTTFSPRAVAQATLAAYQTHITRSKKRTVL